MNEGPGTSGEGVRPFFVCTSGGGVGRVRSTNTSAKENRIMDVPNGLPQLAIGSWNRGKGKACIMNAISYLMGEKDISDMPKCVWAPLSYVAQIANDSICPDEHREDSLNICGPCAHKIWLLGARLIGTAELVTPANKRQVVFSILENLPASHLEAADVSLEWVKTEVDDETIDSVLGGVVENALGYQYEVANQIVDLFYEALGKSRDYALTPEDFKIVVERSGVSVY